METATKRTIRVMTTVVKSDAKTAYWFAHKQPEWKMELKAVLVGLWLLVCSMGIIFAAIYLNTIE